ncbi:MAG: hypothetical protein AAF600_13365 [Bacteroidota bacterium]
MHKLEQQLEGEIDKLLDLADRQDEQDQAIDLDIPEEIKRREDRLARIRAARKVVEERASERYKKEKEDYEQKMQKRQEKQTGKKTSGRAPKEPVNTPKKKDLLIGDMKKDQSEFVLKGKVGEAYLT